MLHKLNNPFVSVPIQMTVLISILFSELPVFRGVKGQKL